MISVQIVCNTLILKKSCLATLTLWSKALRVLQKIKFDNDDILLSKYEHKELYDVTSSNGNGFRVTGPLGGDLPATDGFPSQMARIAGFSVSFDVSLNKRLHKQSTCRWYEKLWRACESYFNVSNKIVDSVSSILYELLKP